MSRRPTIADFEVGERYQNLIGRFLTITGVDVETGMIHYVYEVDDWNPEPRPGFRPAAITSGWRRLP